MMKKYLFVIPIVIVLVLGIIGWNVLPDTVAVQVNTAGQIGNTMPKLAVILLSVGMTVFGSAIGMFGKQSKAKCAIVAAAGVLVMLATLVMNLYILK